MVPDIWKYDIPWSALRLGCFVWPIFVPMFEQAFRRKKHRKSVIFGLDKQQKSSYSGGNQQPWPFLITIKLRESHFKDSLLLCVFQLFEFWYEPVCPLLPVQAVLNPPENLRIHWEWPEPIMYGRFLVKYLILSSQQPKMFILWGLNLIISTLLAIYSSTLWYENVAPDLSSQDINRYISFNFHCIYPWGYKLILWKGLVLFMDMFIIYILFYISCFRNELAIYLTMAINLESKDPEIAFRIGSISDQRQQTYIFAIWEVANMKTIVVPLLIRLRFFLVLCILF